MIIRVLDDSTVKVITGIPSEQEDAFITKNPTGGFQKYTGIIPSSRYGNKKMVSDEVVVDETKEAAALAVQYKIDRKYPLLEEQLDMLYHDMLADKGDKTGNWFAAIKAVKEVTPKP